MRVTPLRESSVEAKAVRLAGDAGWRTIKVGVDGWPDRLFWRDRVYCWVEFKRPGGRPSARQVLRGKELTESGERYILVDDVDEFMAWLCRQT